jgi:hypothetical protein
MSGTIWVFGDTAPRLRKRILHLRRTLSRFTAWTLSLRALEAASAPDRSYALFD